MRAKQGKSKSAPGPPSEDSPSEDRRIDALESRVAALEEENRVAAEEIATLESQVVLLRDSLDQRNAKYRKLRRDLERTNFKRRELREVLTAIESSRSWRVAQALSRLFALLTLRWDRLGEPARKSARTRGSSPAKAATADIVVCVHDALEDVRRCLESLAARTPAEYRVILVNDGSGAETSSLLRRYARRHIHFDLLETAPAEGYTKAANRGLRAATASELVVLLNSDTIVTEGWLEGLLECIRSSPKIGIVGPLSNAASWQSVPERFGPRGDWAINELPSGWDADRMARLVASSSQRSFPRVPLVNGFCFAIRRQVIEAIGGFDEEAFPRGYGEENDYCLRAAAAGFEMAIADHVYVFHAKSKSYSHEVRRQLARSGTAALEDKHGRQAIRRRTDVLRHHPRLEAIRRDLASALSRSAGRESDPAARRAARRLNVLFLMPVSKTGGGVHSVVQEADGMERLGCVSRIAVRRQFLNRFQPAYPSLNPELFYGFTNESLVDLAGHFDVAVATIFTSVKMLAQISEAHPHLLPAYYIQDYEPWIVEPGSDYEKEALESYTLVPGMVCFAKTEWLCRTIREKHGVEVQKVSPSLDTTIYFPPPGGVGPSEDEAVRIAAMIRPSTPRRAPEATMRALRSLAHRLGERVRIGLFGCESDDPGFLELERDFEFENRGVLLREEVAELLRASDVFVDFSTYQAFGRTALEAMACGCAVLVPQRGGASEYAVDGTNALVVDTSSALAMEQALVGLAEDRDLCRKLAAEGLRTASQYSVERAASTELDLMRRAVERHRRGRDVTDDTAPRTTLSKTTASGS